MDITGADEYLYFLREEVQVFIREQLKQREPFYEKAKHIIDINVMDNLDKVNETVQEVRSLLNV